MRTRLASRRGRATVVTVIVQPLLGYQRVEGRGEPEVPHVFQKRGDARAAGQRWSRLLVSRRRLAGGQLEAVPERRSQNCKTVPAAAGRAGKVHDQGRSTQPGDASREKGV